MRMLLIALSIAALAGAFVGAFALGRVAQVETPSNAMGVDSFRDALNDRNPLRRARAVSLFFNRLSEANIDPALELIESRHRWVTEEEHLLLMTAWTAFDESDAIDWALSREAPFRRRASAALVAALAYRDPSSARFLVDSIEDKDFADFLHGHMVEGWARSPFVEELAGYIQAMKPGVARQSATGSLLQEISKSGIQEIMEWVEAIPDDARDDWKQTAFQNAANRVATTKPEAAAKWVADHLGREYAKHAPELVLRRWGDRDAGSALEWIVSHPSADVDIDRVRSIYRNWLRRDRNAAELWARNASPGPTVDVAIGVLVRRDLHANPDAALDWAHRVQDPASRQRTLTRIGIAWRTRDPEGFLAWLPESGLENHIRDSILSANLQSTRRRGRRASRH